MTKKNESSERKIVLQDQHDECKKKKKTMIVEFDRIDIIEELILEFLLRLPATSVLRFKSVCKKWYSLISNPDFLRRHLSLQISRTDLLVHHYTLSSCFTFQHLDFLYLPRDQLQPSLLEIFRRHPLFMFPGKPSHCYLVDSCNGLLLLRYTQKDELSVDTYYVYNPFTRHYLKLPNTIPDPDIREEQLEATTYIVFDPSISLSYKVISWLKYESEGSSNKQCQLYSSETGSWKVLSISFPIDIYFDFDSRPTLLKGVLYWSYWYTPLDVSYCFEVEKESVSSLALPPKPIGFDFRQCLYFGECGGRLRLIEKYLKTLEFVDLLTLPCSFDVLEMQRRPQAQQHQDCCNPWILKYHVNMGMGLNCQDVREHPLQVAFIHFYKMKNKRGEEEDAVFLYINQTCFVSYNLTSNTFGKELTVPKSTTTCEQGFRHFFPFTPTLFPIP